MIGDHIIHGYALVSADHCISRFDGGRPQELRSPVERKRLHAASEQAAVTVLGSRVHQVATNVYNRPRLIVAGSARGLEHRYDGWWWNPREVRVAEALKQAAPEGGIALVIGGRQAFDMFLRQGYDQFTLARVSGVTVPEGVSVFAKVAEGMTPEEVLREGGLTPGEAEMVDPEKGVSLTVWRRLAEAA